VSLQLLALGAPADLVRATHEAAIDEVEHARASYGVAWALARASDAGACAHGPGPLPPTGMPGIDFVSLVEETFDDGCAGETIGALAARAGAERAADEAVRRVLQTIAEDEARHAELAWRTLAWALRRGGARARSALAARLEARLAAAETRAPVASGADDGAFEAWGLLGGRARAELERIALRRLVLPCARALLEHERRAPGRAAKSPEA
jgi:hypothetical protein